MENTTTIKMNAKLVTVSGDNYAATLFVPVIGNGKVASCVITGHINPKVIMHVDMDQHSSTKLEIEFPSLMNISYDDNVFPMAEPMDFQLDMPEGWSKCEGGYCYDDPRTGLLIVNPDQPSGHNILKGVSSTLGTYIEREDGKGVFVIGYDGSHRIYMNGGGKFTLTNINK